MEQHYKELYETYKNICDTLQNLIEKYRVERNAYRDLWLASNVKDKE